MDLESGTPVWLLSPRAPPPAHDDLQGPIDCDVAVVGAGITGALVAYHLVHAGLDVTVLDRRPVGRGSTVASTGLIQYEIDVPLVELARSIGWSAAGRAYLASLGAVRRLGQVASALGTPHLFEARTSLYLASESDDYHRLLEEWSARRRLGIAVDFLGAEDLARAYAIDRPAALLSRDAGQVDPVALTERLISACVAGGARIRVGPGAMVEGVVTGSGGGVSLRAAGGTVTARAAVFATGYESQAYLDEPVASLHSTFAVALPPSGEIAGWSDRCLIWETARPYLYLRIDSGGRAIIGGEDEDTSDAAQRDAMIGAKAERLSRRARALFPSLPQRADCAWAGTFAETRDGLPYIGCPPTHPGVWFALGYGGNGITFSLLAAEIIRDALLGRPHADAGLFAFGR